MYWVCHFAVAMSSSCSLNFLFLAHLLTIQGTIGFSICPRFIELKKYNLRQLQDQAREKAKTARKEHVEKEEE